MTDTTTPAELEIPQAAWNAARDTVESCRVAGTRLAGRGAIGPIVTSTARIIVAAELRRFADEIADDAARIKRALPSNGSTYSDIDRADLGRVIQGEDDARMLRARADELDPQT